MKTIRSTTLALCFVLVATGSALAGPPLATDDAGTVDVGKVEIELNGSYSHDSSTSSNFDGKYFNWINGKAEKTELEAKITTGIWKNVAASLTVPYTVDERTKDNNQVTGTTNGFGDMTLEIKYNFLQIGDFSFTAKPVLIIPAGKYSAGLSEGRWQYGGTLIATKTFDEEKYAIHANVSYEHHDYRTDEARDNNLNDLYAGSIAAEAELFKGFVVGVDFGVGNTQDSTTKTLSAYTLGGARYEITENLGVNAGMRFGLTTPEDDFSVLYGIVLNF